MRKIIFNLVLIFAAISSLQAADIPENLVKEFDLENGMHFIVLEKHEFPTVSCVIFFDVGAADEPRGKTGMAHLLEHLMFKGMKDFGTTDWEKEKVLFENANLETRKWIEALDESRKSNPVGVFKDEFQPEPTESMQAIEARIKEILEKEREYIIKDEFWGTYNRHGGRQQNAFTGLDYTGYYVVLPANKLELWAFLDSARMKDAIFREFYSERDVVMEEKRLRGSNPDSKVYRMVTQLAFRAHPYGRPVVGFWDDLYHLSHEDIRNFFKTYYNPNNAVAVIVGDVSLEYVKSLADRFFAPMRPGKVPKRFHTTEPPLGGTREGTVYYDAQPQIALVYRVPGIDHPDFPALQLASSVLGMGASSRLHRRLVLDERIAESVNTWCPEQRDPFLFFISSAPFKDHTTDEIEKVIREEIKKLVVDGPEKRELEKVRNRYHANSVYRLESPVWFATWLAKNYVFYKDWKAGYRYLDRIDAVSPADIQRVLKKYIVPENEIKVVLKNDKKGAK